MGRTLAATGFCVVGIYSLISISWVHAASVSAFSPDCGSELLVPARAAITELFGSIESDPIITCLDGPRLGIDVAYGQTRFAAGLPAVVLIGVKGRDINVVAHELAHAELAARIGLLARELRVPTWFDEGLAMQVDHREDYNAIALSRFAKQQDLHLPVLDEISSGSFFTPGDQGKYHYALSKCIVSQWRGEQAGGLDRIADIERQQFEDLYVAGLKLCVGRPF